MTGTEVTAQGGQRCLTCGDGFSGRSNARYCSASCRKRAFRDRRGVNRPNRPASGGTVSIHGAAATALLAALDEELAANAGVVGQTLMWSAAEVELRELIAGTIDRRAELEALYASSVDDAKLRLKIAGELRLTDAAVARLLREVKTELPPLRSKTSEKAARAASTRWRRHAGH